MKEDDEDDLERALAATPWQAILLPFIAALIVLAAFLVIKLIS